MLHLFERFDPHERETGLDDRFERLDKRKARCPDRAVGSKDGLAMVEGAEELREVNQIIAEPRGIVRIRGIRGNPRKVENPENQKPVEVGINHRRLWFLDALSRLPEDACGTGVRVLKIRPRLSFKGERLAWIKVDRRLSADGEEVELECGHADGERPPVKFLGTEIG